MDAWDAQTTSPDMGFEASPAESFLSLPGEMYPPLFGSSSAVTMNPIDIMTPSSEDRKLDLSALAQDDVETPETPGASSPAAGEKRQTKKRKSWGQVLPEPKTNLPPRKRAKTEDEKEQRRVERVLRNRRAAQSSRERKRLEVEALEEKNKQLEARLMEMEKTNMLLFEELKKTRGNSSVVAQNPLTLSKQLFVSQDGHNRAVEGAPSPIEQLMAASQSHNTTINPTSLSPAMTPVADDSLEQLEAEVALKTVAEATTTENISTDLTQHPAEVLCSDLQCQSAEMSRFWRASQQPLPQALALYCQLTMLLTSAMTLLSVCQRPLMQIAISLRAGSSLPPSPAILTTIIWLVTTPSRPSRTSTSTTSSTTTRRTTAAAPQPTPPSTTLRLKLLRKILTCSPMLARPLMDATLAVLRSVQSEEPLDVDRVVRDVGSTAGPVAQAAPASHGGWLDQRAPPSAEVLLTLLWAVKSREQRWTRARKCLQPIASQQPGRISSAFRIRKMAPTTTSSDQRSISYVPVNNKRSSREGSEGRRL